jgi:hypothetical protein
MPPFVHNLDITNVDQIVEHFQNIPDMTEHILECDTYPFIALGEALETLYDAKNHAAPNSQEFKDYERTITKIESVISTRIDYVNSIIDHLLGKETFDDTTDFSLDDSPTKEILSHIDLMKDVSRSSEINQKDYKAALRKFLKTLKFRFNKGLEIHKRLHNLEFEDIAEKQDDFPHDLLEEQKGFLEDALTMTRNHVPVTHTQIHQLKETLFKILESMGVRVLQMNSFNRREEHGKILRRIEDVVIGFEVDFGQKFIKRFSGMLPQYIADHWNTHVIKHNRKVAELLVDLTDDAALLEELYQILINLTTAEAAQLQKKQELSRVTLKHIQGLRYVKDEENAQRIEMERFKSLDLNERARELIKLSIYGLCEYLSKISVEELRKYPIGIIRSTEKVLGDLEQHKLKKSDVTNIQNSPEYISARETIQEAMAIYHSSDEKYNFADIYKETDYTVDDVTFCAFNNIILRVIQNITEAYFVVDSGDQNLSEQRLSELQITIVERYKSEWIRQNELQQKIEQETMEELAEELA